jgi:hypothetical protein
MSKVDLAEQFRAMLVGRGLASLPPLTQNVPLYVNRSEELGTPKSDIPILAEIITLHTKPTQPGFGEWSSKELEIWVRCLSHKDGNVWLDNILDQVNDKRAWNMGAAHISYSFVSDGLRTIPTASNKEFGYLLHAVMEFRVLTSFIR